MVSQCAFVMQASSVIRGILGKLVRKTTPSRDDSSNVSVSVKKTGTVWRGQKGDFHSAYNLGFRGGRSFIIPQVYSLLFNRRADTATAEQERT